MNAKMIGASLATAALVAFPLAACGSSSTPVVTATPTTPMHPALQKIQDDADRRWAESHPGQDVNVHRAAERAATAQAPRSQDSGLPWWAWMVIVPGGLVALLVLGFKVMEWNDERQVQQAEARVDELDARAARRASRVLDYDDFEDDEEDDDELDEEDVAFLHRVTDPAPSAPAPSAPPADGNLLSSLRQQGGGAQ